MKDEIRVLLVDDEIPIRQLITPNLLKAGYTVREALTAQEAMALSRDFHPHLILLDLGLPDAGGLDVLISLRKWTAIPILILTATDDPATKVQLLDAGADDYLTKPFSIPELLARVRVGLRHQKSLEATPIFESGDLWVDVSQGLVKVRGEFLKLTHTELELLKALAREHGRVVSQSQLLKQVWGPAAQHESHYLRIYMGHLRKKIEKDPSHPQHLLTEPGVGYRLV